MPRIYPRPEASTLYVNEGPDIWAFEDIYKMFEQRKVPIVIEVEGRDPVEIKTAEDVRHALDTTRADAWWFSDRLNLQPGPELDDFKHKLRNLVDDIAKKTGMMLGGQKVTLGPNQEMAKVLGFYSPATLYGSGQTTAGEPIPAQGSLRLADILLSFEKPDDPLEGLVFIDSSVFDGPRWDWPRDGLECEMVYGLGNVTAEQVLKLARSEGNGRPLYRWRAKDAPDATEWKTGEIEAGSRAEAIDLLRAQNKTLEEVEGRIIGVNRRSTRGLRRLSAPRDAASFTMGYHADRENPLDFVPWDARSHRLREETSLLSLRPENGRLQWDPEDREFEVTLGTDFCLDFYHRGRGKDVEKDVFLENPERINFRYRFRMDTPDAGRRVLIQVKFGAKIDPNGMKTALKIDARESEGEPVDAAFMARFKENVMRGLNGEGQPSEPIARMHAALSEHNLLETIGPHANILMLELGSCVRSERKRFHWNENPKDVPRATFRMGATATAELLEAVTASALAPNVKARLRRLAKPLVDAERATLIRRCERKLVARGAVAPVTKELIDKLLPRGAEDFEQDTKDEAEQREIVADAVSALYHKFAQEIEPLAREISGFDGADAMNAVRRRFKQWMIEEKPDLLEVQTEGPFLEGLRAGLRAADPAERAAFIERFAVFSETDGDPTLKNASAEVRDTVMSDLEKCLLAGHLEIRARQVGAAGTAAKSDWVNELRRAYNGNDPQTWNVFIDTFDLCEYYTPAAWDALSPEQQSGAELSPDDSMYHARISADVQLELAYAEPYLLPINEARNALFAGFFMDHSLAAKPNEVWQEDMSSFRGLLERMILPQQDAEWLSPEEVAEARVAREVERKELLAGVNKLAKQRGSKLVFVDGDLERVRQDFEKLKQDALRDGQEPPAEPLFKADQLNRPAEAIALLDRDFARSTQVWKLVQDAQENLSKLRADAVLRAVRSIDRDIPATWVPVEKSKGEESIDMAPA